MRFIALLLLAAAGCTAPAAAPPSSTLAPGACFQQGQATSWVPVDEHTILVRDLSRAFRVTTNNCPSLRDPLVSITRVLPGGDRICGRQDVRLYLSDHPGGIPVPCFIQGIEALSPEQAQALEAAVRR